MREQKWGTSSRFCSRLPLLLAGVGVLLLLGAFLLFLSARDTTVGDVQAIQSSLEPHPVPLTAPTTTVEEPETGIEPRSDRLTPNETSLLENLTRQTPAVPIRLMINGISVDAPVEPYGVNERTGQMAVPRNVTDVAWYEYGPAPGEPGSAVLAAHVDLAGQGPGVFYRLRDVTPGDHVVIEYSDGSTRVFVIRARVTYEKDDLPLETIFSRAGSPVLTLITCGGGFSESSQSYDSNVVAYAVPLETGSSGRPPANE